MTDPTPWVFTGILGALWVLSEVRGILERGQAFEERQGLLNRLQAQSGESLERLDAHEARQALLKAAGKAEREDMEYREPPLEERLYEQPPVSAAEGRAMVREIVG